MRLSSSVITSSECSAFNDAIQRERIPSRHLPYAVDPPPASSDFKARYNISRDCFIILNITYSWERQNHLQFFKSLDSLPDDWRFVIISQSFDASPSDSDEKIKPPTDSRFMYLANLGEQEIYDALAIDTYNRFRNADPPTIIASLFNEFNDFSPEVGLMVKKNLLLNSRLEEKLDPNGNLFYFFTNV
ncbi:MAG: hypothetical protein ACFFD1_05295 [Candidatus Thorarchaeota archaeon]